MQKQNLQKWVKLLKSMLSCSQKISKKNHMAGYGHISGGKDNSLVYPRPDYIVTVQSRYAELKVNKHEIKTSALKVLSITIFHSDNWKDKCPADFVRSDFGRVHRLCATE